MGQKFTAIGNLGGEVEMRFLPNGTEVGNFSLAINERFVTAEGEAKESTLWVRVTVWRKLATNCAQYLHKGSKVSIWGKLKPASAYTDKNGKNVASIEVTADEVEFLDGRSQNDDGGAAAMATQASKKSPDTADIPF